jgi:hypothetical protein
VLQEVHNTSQQTHCIIIFEILSSNEFQMPICTIM